MMPKMGIIKTLAQKQGKAPAQLVHDTYAVMGTLHKTAVALGVYDGTIRYWLRMYDAAQAPVIDANARRTATSSGKAGR